MITASIVVFNSSESDLRKVLECSMSSCIEFIYLIDNSSKDAFRKVIESYNSNRIIYIFGHGNIGYGSAHNKALNKAIESGSKYHIVLNPDIYFHKHTLEKITAFMDNHEDVGYLLPNVTYLNGERQYLCKLIPTPLDILNRKFLPKKIADIRNKRYEMRATGYNKTRNVPILSGCFMFLRMDVIKKIGMFDDRFFMYFEDFDLIRRIHQISKTIFFPDVTIIHNHAEEHRTNIRLFKISMQSAIKYFNKWGWLFDTERKKVNKTAFSNENIIE